MSKAATKALIDANITGNGVQAITGPILNNVLNTMVDDYGTQDEVSQLAQKVSDISTGKYYGYHSSAASLPDDAEVDGFAYVGTGPTYTIYNCEGGVWTSSGITVNQSPIGNDEDIDQNEDGKLQFADRVYDSQNPGGMGYKILRKDKTFAEQVTEANTIYEIRYDFDLEGASVTIPENCVLKFEGGSLSNGAIAGQGTDIRYFNVCFSNISISGTWALDYVDAAIFKDVESDDVLKQAFALCEGEHYTTLYIGTDLVCPVSVAAAEGSAIIVPSNTLVLLDGTIQLIANNLWGYKVVYINSENIVIRGSGKICGDFERGHIYEEDGEHDSHQWGRCLAIWGAANVEIDGIECSNATGDAFSISEGASNIVLNNIYGHTSRRQGLTIQNCSNVRVENYVFEDISGYPPMAGIDIEPNSDNINNVCLINGVIKRCTLGVSIYQAETATSTGYNNIEISNLHLEDIGGDYGIGINSRITKTQVKLENLTYTRVPRTLFSLVYNASISAKNIKEIYSSSDLCTSIICGARYTDNIVEIDNFRGRICPKFYAGSGKSRITFKNSSFILEEQRNSALSGIYEDFSLHIDNCTFKSESDDTELTLYGSPLTIEHSFFDLNRSIYIGNRAITTNILFATLRNNTMKFNNTGNVNGLVSNPISSVDFYVRSVDNKIDYQGTSYPIVVFNGFFSEEGSVIIHPNSTMGSIFNNVPTKWNLLTPTLYKGETTTRPSLAVNRSWVNTDEGHVFYDTTLKKPIWWNGNQWLDAAGNAADTKISGATVDRPTTGISAGFQYFDTTLSKPIWWNGTAWVDSTGTAV